MGRYQQIHVGSDKLGVEWQPFHMNFRVGGWNEVT